MGHFADSEVTEHRPGVLWNSDEMKKRGEERQNGSMKKICLLINSVVHSFGYYMFVISDFIIAIW